MVLIVSIASCTHGQGDIQVLETISVGKPVFVSQINWCFVSMAVFEFLVRVCLTADRRTSLSFSLEPPLQQMAVSPD